MELPREVSKLASWWIERSIGIHVSRWEWFNSCIYIQIIATENTSFQPIWWCSKGNPFISRKSRLVKYYDLAGYKPVNGLFGGQPVGG